MCSGSTIPCGCETGKSCKPQAISGTSLRAQRGNLRQWIKDIWYGTQYNSLGLVAQSKRPIKPGHEYNQYIDLGSVNQRETPIADGEPKHTLRDMERLATKYAYQTERLAKKLKGQTLTNTLKNIWQFLYDHVQYTLDKDGVEQLRTPARTWADRSKGVDCDCYSIFISSILNNVGISHAFRMAKYSGDWQHVYVVVPTDGNKSSLQTRLNTIVVDPVKDRFNEEHPYTAKHDRFMKRTVLSGLGTTACQTQSKPPTGYDLSYIPVKELKNMDLKSTEEFLTEEAIPFQVVKEDNGQLAIAMQAGGTMLKVPTIISDEQAEALKKTATEMQTQTTETEPVKAGIGNGWLWALLATGVGIAVLSAQKPSKKGLSGTPKNNRKPAKRSKRKPTPKTPTITI